MSDIIASNIGAPAAPGLVTDSSPAAVQSDINAHVNAKTGNVQLPPADWKSGLKPELKGYIDTKGFKDVGQLADSYLNLEKAMGAPRERLLKLPENATDKEAMNEIFSKLGRPSKPEDYKLEVPEGSPTDFADWAKGQFFELGLTATQASELTKQWNAYQAGKGTEIDTEMTAKADQDVKDLKREWGAAHDTNLKLSQRAARTLGLDEGTIEGIEKSLGYKKTMTLFNDIGKKIGEDSFVSSNSGGSAMGMTPEAAQSRIQTLKNAAEWTGKMYNGDSAQQDEWDRLHKMAFGGY